MSAESFRRHRAGGTRALASCWPPRGRPARRLQTTLGPALEPGDAAGTAWIPELSRPTLFSGSLSPGGYGWKYMAPVQPAAARTLVAAFNGRFQFPSTDGGYYSEGKLVFSLRAGAASLVIYKNGSAAEGATIRSHDFEHLLVT